MKLFCLAKILRRIFPSYCFVVVPAGSIIFTSVLPRLAITPARSKVYKTFAAPSGGGHYGCLHQSTPTIGMQCPPLEVLRSKMEFGKGGGGDSRNLFKDPHQNRMF